MGIKVMKHKEMCGDLKFRSNPIYCVQSVVIMDRMWLSRQRNFGKLQRKLSMF